jgi:UDP-glucuronate 4-epimerase
MYNILITGFAGFIGSSLIASLKNKYNLVAFDNFSKVSNYDIKLQRAEHLGVTDPQTLQQQGAVEVDNTTYYYADLCNVEQLENVFSKHQFSLVIHLAALTGVRPSLQNPQAYIDVNVKGFVNLLECARKYGVNDIIYASSSSVYGSNTEIPYTEEQRTDSPISAYAASKKADELLANVYAHLYGMNMIGLRFFTVYGPWTRPDMAAYIFMDAIHKGKSIELFNEGKMIRDFTYVGDVVQSISLLIDKMNDGSKGKNLVFNVGNHQPVQVMDFLNAIEQKMNKKAVITYKPIQPGDMPATNAVSDRLFSYTGYKPATTVQQGVNNMVDWFTAVNAVSQL